MIKYVIPFLLSGVMLNAQENVNVGDVLEIGSPDARTYKHIDFPRANFIIKRGGIANYKNLKGQKVVVTAIEEKKDGSKEIKLKKVNGNRFFGSHAVVAANYRKALETGELVLN
ncbi:hypothetical protein [Pseudozobellia thermophila]|uniref:Uncharacterized protein n=1 Tax=Pseudozobellia thermophila TaxID=192903 RepID=A0A1M6IT35_9FLAO|nr:hypothetical protein [Pseudozobellia thermophila]SHJ37519.1 hypothetical protein SAMN04488513_104107 [Pseudozobellia thermophila]